MKCEHIPYKIMNKISMPAITTSSQHGTRHLSKDRKRYNIEKEKIRFYLQKNEHLPSNPDDLQINYVIK